jgi:amino acid transporter
MAISGGGPGGRRGLRRELRFWETIALSIGIMAPTAAMALNGVAVAGLVGQAVPLVFVIAGIGVGLVSYAFIRLSRHFAHAGSVYAFSGATLGPQAGFFAGWALFGTYLAFTAASSSEVGLFGGAFLDGTGIWHNPPWLLIALVAAALIALLAYGDIKVATRTLLAIEVVSVTLIIILMIDIFVKIIAGSAPGHRSFGDAFSLPSGTSFSVVGAAFVFAFLSWGGFEGAAALGEETNDPRREIPKAIRNAVIISTIFYILCELAQTLGFGTDKAGVGLFSGSFTPLADLGHTYIGSAMGDVINLGAAVSGFASALGTATGASRILYAMGRDGFVSPRLGTSSGRTGAPAVALACVMTVAVLGMIAMWLYNLGAVAAFFYPGTLGVLSMIVAYVVTNAGALKLFGLDRRERGVDLALPVLAILILAYVLYRNITNQPYPFNWFPWVVAGWLAAGLAIVLLVPGLARRIGTTMSQLEGPETVGVDTAGD